MKDIALRAKRTFLKKNRDEVEIMNWAKTVEEGIDSIKSTNPILFWIFEIRIIMRSIYLEH